MQQILIKNLIDFNLLQLKGVPGSKNEWILLRKYLSRFISHAKRSREAPRNRFDARWDEDIIFHVGLLLFIVVKLVSKNDRAARALKTVIKRKVERQFKSKIFFTFYVAIG